MSEAEQTVVRAAWETCRRMGMTIDVAVEFRERLEAQIDQWHADDAVQVEGVAA